ncbi:MULTISPECIES: 30S ribosomal protein S4 [unclassified Candidatus Frackibacter]|uniref:30S ribosomal protein S4 n=1 Tax=unclassified Candidatus Frackibacter TaxID=2648818 RepID=UPI000791D2BC|nr:MULTISPECIES: 30S ribosomal protein S4 [unclassified Candidatus Frackibacter]KXS45791.1 MAG: small subunit ribosomal protein S4 [Candidatus Frackibacter sp. T328-2]SDC22647.1 SSU ribosomal protein S4P [Candidatus Frackibacter sp. WG11]SEM49246.1 SSU ribosomal protein S4P [Candidatus Frackibacter sp. WG12]SFL50816.1 SSU ribosomal protein S4P [Candidatus Frackibacter sp. WG13]
MARYTGAVCRQCRREGEKLFLKGERCYSDKCAVERRSYAPGEHGQGRQKLSEFGVQLREKQKVRRIYGVLEKQFRKYFGMADNEPGITGENFLRILERRLDNVVYRLGFAVSRNEARQLVRHGHFLVNGKRVDIPSYLVEEGDEIEVKDSSKDMTRMKEVVEVTAQKAVPEWLEVSLEQKTGKVLSMPEREDIDTPVREQLIVEFYSR